MLDKLAEKYGTDKSSHAHNYAEKYNEVLLPFREKFTNIVEIGVDQNKSLKTWEEYFPNATIHGLDINPDCKKYEDGRIKITTADQSNVEQLIEFGKLGPFDFIIDDGSHVNKHQIISFQALFQFLKRGGIYAIEDTFTSYLSEDYGYGGRTMTCMNYFKNLIDEVNYFGRIRETPTVYHEDGWWYNERSTIRREDVQETKTDIRSIQFWNGIILIYKKPEGYA